MCDKPQDHLCHMKEAAVDYGNLLELIDHINDPPMRASKAVASSVAVNGVQYCFLTVASVTLVVFIILLLTSITEVSFVSGVGTSL